MTDDLDALLDLDEPPDVWVDEHGARRAPDGKFLPGTTGGPGRPAGIIEFSAVCRKFAKVNGLDVEELMWVVAKGLFRAAAKGDAKASRILLDRLCGPVERSPSVQVNVDTQRRGPPVPSARELGNYLQEFVAASKNLLSVEVVDPVDDLLA